MKAYQQSAREAASGAVPPGRGAARKLAALGWRLAQGPVVLFAAWVVLLLSVATVAFSGRDL